MNKKELIRQLSIKTWLSQDISKLHLKAIMDIIEETLKQKENVNITWFWKFIIKDKKEREVRNPKTWEKLILPRHKTIKFQISKKLKTLLIK